MTFNKRNIMAYAIDYVDTNDCGPHGCWSRQLPSTTSSAPHVRQPAAIALAPFVCDTTNQKAVAATADGNCLLT